jgi:outer membrane protein assembly factor BamD
LGLLALTLALMPACGAKRDARPVDPALADRFLLDKGNEAASKKKWLEAREYYRELVENYPQSSYRSEAKLGLGETYLGESSGESLVMAAHEFREFLTFFPTSALAPRAQFKLAMTYFEQMHSADRDQTPTKQALSEFGRFFVQYPDGPATPPEARELLPEAREKWRVARDRLSEASYRVGLTYYKRKWPEGAISRFREVIKEDPEFSGIDGVYFHLAESLAKVDKTVEAVPLFDRVVREYKTSEYVEKAQKRLKELQPLQAP